MQPVINGYNTEDGRMFVLPSTRTDNDAYFGHPVYLSNHLLNSFEASDKRKLNWIDSVIVENDTFYFLYKYKAGVRGEPVTEYFERYCDWVNNT